jgi:hypothetical protein
LWYFVSLSGQSLSAVRREEMIRVIRKAAIAIAVGALSTMMATSAFADDWPLVGGDYWEVTGIHISDGGGWKYANWLATEWRKNLEFTKSKGWIKDYMILANVHARKGEADLYLVRVREDLPSGKEGEKRQDEYQEWVKKSNEQMVDESGNRAEYREVGSDSLLQVLTFRD